MKNVVFFSSGIGSWAAAKRVAEQHGTDGLVLLFADTLIEDKDNYRFLIESAADVFGISRACLSLPLDTIARIPEGWSDEEIEVRKILLWQACNETRVLIPGLAWIQDGRTPWDVYKEQKFFIGKTVAHCSKWLKSIPCVQWIKNNCSLGTSLYFGFDWLEIHRLESAQKKWAGYSADAPLIYPPFDSKQDLVKNALSLGLLPPRMYFAGYPHANCAGGCIRAGFAHWTHLYKTNPEVFKAWERKEEEIRASTGKDITILARQRKTKMELVTLAQLRKELDSDAQIDLFDWGGCGCFVDDSSEVAA